MRENQLEAAVQKSLRFCIGFALALHVFFRSDLLCNLQSLHRLLPKEAATSATIEIKTIETGGHSGELMRVLRV